MEAEEPLAGEKSTKERDLEIRSKKKMKRGYQQMYLHDFLHNETEDMEVVLETADDPIQSTEG